MPEDGWEDQEIELVLAQVMLASDWLLMLILTSDWLLMLILTSDWLS